jgi:hypothetical protein
LREQAWRVGSICRQSKEAFPFLLAEDGEAALLQDAYGARVVLGDRRMEGTACFSVAQEL